MLWEGVAAVPRHATVTAAGLSLTPPLSERAMRYRLQVAAEKGISLNSPPAPDGFITKGVSTLYDGDGTVKSRWVKDHLDRDKAKAAMEETLGAFMEPLRGRASTIKTPKVSESDTLSEYIIADLHLGAYVWDEDGEESYDTSIASADCKAAIDRLIASTPPSETCMINQIGDFFHADSQENTTTAGTRVDTDTRYRRVVREGVKTLRYVVEACRKKHQIVRIRNTPGNHDTHTSAILDFALSAYYENDPRVIVEDDARPFWAYTFGENLVGIGHGHAPKPKDMPGLLAHDYAEKWSAHKFKYCRHGHLHSERSFESMGVVCEGFRTICPKDAWHTAAGYRSGREAVAIVLHKDYGEIERHTAGIARIRNDGPSGKAQER